MSFVARLKEAQKKAQERTGSWQLRLEGLKGKYGTTASSGSARRPCSTSSKSRTAGACRRLAKLMFELGWHPVKARVDRVRGFARDTRGEALM